MKKYDVVCPLCGHINRNMYLDETDGWMECSHCHNTVLSMSYPRRMVRIPVIELEDLPKEREGVPLKIHG